MKDYMPERVHGGEQYHVCCPFCGDTRCRLYVGYTWDRSLRTADGKLIYAGKRAICHNEDCLADKENFKKFDALVKANLSVQDNTPLGCVEGRGPAEDDVFAMPPGCIPLADPAVPPGVQEYVSGRGFDLAELSEGWQVQVGRVPGYPGPMLVFPIHQGGELRAWQARYPGEGYKQLGRPKYWWPSGVVKSWLLYNMDRARLYPCVVVTEGILDAVRVGPAGVALFGKVPSTRQETMLVALWRNGTLVWIPDADDPASGEAARRHVDRWNRRALFRNGAHVVELASGDPGSTPQGEIWKLIKTSVPCLSGCAGGSIPSGSGTGAETSR